VILATASTLSRPDPDEGVLEAALAAAGVESATLSWDDPEVAWASARACVIRSTWNYVHHHREFLAWADRCAGVTALWNPAPVVRWNSHKAYLAELAEGGLPVVPTQVVRRGTQDARLEELVAGWPAGFEHVVVKPAVSAGSFATIRVARADLGAGQAHLEQMLPTRDMLVQPYLRSVEGEGERALVWIDGTFTHAVRKSPRFSGEGEQVSPALPVVADERQVAEQILAAAPGPLLYARVDLARDDAGRPCLMELELIEPLLFLRQSPLAAARLAEAIAVRV
jgi:glutathione synthase/RimK-type ligase-like ATP-grasp enzyme